ncbi:MAG: helix-turn-helix domain-containing protein [Cyclobacteriaceae bacterium]|nr:helix-turn-helix domain-containing protein [Cyclobacteriaceae bacterium]
MKVREVRLFKNPNQSFVFYHEKESFSKWHYHPEYELALIKKGEGIRLIGDHIERFDEEDLAFLGSYLPHEWRCLDKFYLPDGSFTGEGLVVQFLHDSFGKHFFELPENRHLSEFLKKSSQGCSLYGKTQEEIILRMKEMIHMDEINRLYNLFSIFQILGSTKEYKLLSSPAFLEPYQANGNEPLKNVIQYIHQNFQKEIKVDELLEISNMSNTTFFTSFKKMYRMTFKKYLLSIRIGYACRLLADQSLNISQIAYESGFENLSNFNRQFKALKGCTPGEYKKHF